MTHNPSGERIARCPSCDGYGWFEDEMSFEAVDCDWCRGIGYVYRDARGVDRAIPEADYARVAARLEALEAERMREIGYSGIARHPDEQPIRRQDPPEDNAQR